MPIVTGAGSTAGGHKAIIQRQQRMPPERDDHCFLRFRKNGRTRLFKALLKNLRYSIFEKRSNINAVWTRFSLNLIQINRKTLYARFSSPQPSHACATSRRFWGAMPSSLLSCASEACDRSGRPSDRWRADPHYCSSDGVRGRVTPVTNLSHMASFHSIEKIAPANLGIKRPCVEPARMDVEAATHPAHRKGGAMLGHKRVLHFTSLAKYAVDLLRNSHINVGR